MRISERWLREWVSLRLTTEELVSTLTLAGIEAGVAARMPALPQVVVGRILRCEPHPDADRLQVCTVDVGEKAPRTIVCGAPNARTGLTAPVALPGACLPGDRQIKEARVRGVESAGMLCSAQELGLTDTVEGLMVLPDDARPGTLIDDLLALPDTILEIELTPNRGDCLSIAGLARELVALARGRMRAPKIKPVPSRGQAKRAVVVRRKADCPRYVGRVVTGVDPNARTPVWMAERLRRGGIRTIHPVVDVTNYVMLEVGQPMHAFDLGRLDSSVTVRSASAGEHLRLLDAREIELQGGELVIADRTGPLALAGVMGGLGSAVSEGTTALFLESAYFRPETVAAGARRHGLHTDSSHRFERGVDPLLQRVAIDRASELLRAIVGGEYGPITEVVSKKDIPRRAPIVLRAARIARVLGVEVRPTVVQAALVRIGMKAVRTRDGWRVTPPSYRFDIKEEIDLIEEVARMYGYAELPVALPIATIAEAGQADTLIPADRLRNLLVDRDYQEVITYAFVDPVLQARLDPERPAARLSNPIASNMAVMRTNLWPGLIDVVRHNLHRQQNRVRVFELGARFSVTAEGPHEEQALAGAITGPALPEQWGGATRGADFFDLKGDVEALLALGGPGRIEFRAARHPALHPGRSAQVVQDGNAIGWLGELHPSVAREFDLRQPVFLFELLSAPIQMPIDVKFTEISRFPSIRRDLAVVVDDAVSASAVLETVRAATGELLAELRLFDEYRGEGIDSGRKSLALALTLQDSSRTLNEEVVEAVLARVVAALSAAFGAQLRQ